MRPRARHPALLLPMTLAALSACGGDPSAPAVTAGSIVAVSAVALSGIVGEEVAPRPRVLVRDREGGALAGVSITFRVLSGSGSVSATGTPFETVTVTSDTSGHAEVTWKLGTAPGKQTLGAEVVGAAPVFFTAFVSPGTPTRILPRSSTDQAEEAGAYVSEPLTVIVFDRYGNPVPKVPVYWSAPAASIGMYSSTDSTGIARLTMRVGWYGGGSMFAIVEGLSSVEFRMVGLIVRSDPLEDLFVTAASDGYEPPDIWYLGAARDVGRGDVVVQLVFRDTVARASDGGPRAISGWVDLDVIGGSSGYVGKADALRPPGSGLSGLGVEFAVDLTPDVTGLLPIVLLGSGELVGHATPRFGGTRVMIRVPLAVLWNVEGNINLAAIAGTPAEMTDVVPNDGMLSVGAVGGSSLPRMRQSAVR